MLNRTVRTNMINHSFVRVRDCMLAVCIIARDVCTDEEELEIHHIVNDDLEICCEYTRLGVRLDTNLEPSGFSGCVPATCTSDDGAESRVQVSRKSRNCVNRSLILSVTVLQSAKGTHVRGG
jgi:hypothetical protein